MRNFRIIFVIYKPNIMKSICKYTLMFLCLAAAFVPARAQEEAEHVKPNVLVVEFPAPEGIKEKWVDAVRNNVITGLQATGRVNVIDTKTQDAVNAELARRAEGVASGGDISRTGKIEQQGANYILQGEINDITITKTEEQEPKKDANGNVVKNAKGETVYVTKKDSNGNVICTYKPTITVTLKILEANSGNLVYTNTIKSGDGGLFDFSNFGKATAYSEDDAVTTYANAIPKRMGKFVTNSFPIEGRVLRVQDVKKDKAETVLINLGSKRGVRKGMKFIVRCLMDDDGNVLAYRTDPETGKQTVPPDMDEVVERREIGQIEIVDVTSGKRSLCKVKEGGKALNVMVPRGDCIIITEKD